ncbi:MAG: hypothetical protein WC752_00015 [Patescibacteria group bacterium]|jgi:hypothetical protein
MVVLNYILGGLAFLSNLGLLIGIPGTIIALIVEANREPDVTGRRSLRLTKKYGIIAGGSFILLIITLTAWGVSTYFLSNSMADSNTLNNSNIGNNNTIKINSNININSNKNINANIPPKNENVNSSVNANKIYNECFYLVKTSANCQKKTAIPSTRLDKNQDNVHDLGSDKSSDSDLDGINDVEENLLGLNSKKADSDGDGFDDGEEIVNGFNPDGPGLIEYQFETTEEWAQANLDKFGTTIQRSFNSYFTGAVDFTQTN